LGLMRDTPHQERLGGLQKAGNSGFSKLGVGWARARPNRNLQSNKVFIVAHGCGTSRTKGLRKKMGSFT